MTMKNSHLLKVGTLIAASSMLLASCQTGAGTGAATGAAIGGLAQILTGERDQGKIVKGVAIGAAAGAATGAVIDHRRQQNSPANYPQYGGDTGTSQPVPNSGYHYGRQGAQPTYRQPASTSTDPYGTVDDYRPAPQPQAPPQYPYATRTATSGVVISPHAPHREIDVKGFAPGQPVLDPIANKPFLVP